MESCRLGVYRHYKGGLYTVLHIGTHTETQEQLVVYTPVISEKKDGVVDHPVIWIRPLTMFLESVSVDGVTVPRFVYQG